MLGMRTQKGYFTQFTLGCCLSFLAISNALSQWRSTLTARVSKLLDKTQALKGESDPPVFRAKR